MCTTTVYINSVKTSCMVDRNAKKNKSRVWFSVKTLLALDQIDSNTDNFKKRRHDYVSIAIRVWFGCDYN